MAIHTGERPHTGGAGSKLPGVMPALRKVAPQAGFALQEIPLPQIGATDILIRVQMAGICGTDLHIYEWDRWAQHRVRPPITVGHEFMGTVAAVGAEVEGFTIDERVSAEGHIACGKCALCRTGEAHICNELRVIGVDRDGAFAHYIAMPQQNVWKLAATIPDQYAAVFDPLGNAVHSVMTAGVSGKTVLITGAGAIGLMAINVARAAGAVSVFAVDVRPEKLELAKRLGADEAFIAADPSWIEKLRSRTDGVGPDVLLEMSGSAAAIEQGLTALRNGGHAALLGLPPEKIRLDVAESIIFKGVTLYGIHGRRMFETWYQMQRMVKNRRIDLKPIITHVLPLESFDEAFGLLKAGTAAKIILDLR